MDSGGNMQSSEERNAEKLMDNYLKSIGFHRKKIAKDGSCLFRAVAEQVNRGETSKKKMFVWTTSSSLLSLVSSGEVRVCLLCLCAITTSPYCKCNLPERGTPAEFIERTSVSLPCTNIPASNLK